MSSFLGDVTGSKKVKYNNHFAFQGKLDLRHWKVYTELAWDIHTDNQPEGNGLSVLADSEKGFMIVESGNALGIRFFVTKRCPEAIALLDAFIATKHANMIDREYLDLSAQHAYFDEDHPLQVHYKPSQMTSVKARPASAAVKRAASQDTSLVNPLKQ